MKTEKDARRELLRVSHLLWERGWVANHDGNVTLRLPQDRVLATPTAYSKAQIAEEDLLVVDLDGRKVSGRTRPFSELGLHLRVYRARPDVQAVVHAHPPTATGFALSGQGLDIPAMPEMVVTLGPGIPTVPYAFPGPEAEAALAPFLPHHDAVLLARHGVLCWGDDAEQAYLRMELVEHVARISLVAFQLGGVPSLPREQLDRLLAARRKAGLGAAGRADKAGKPEPDLGRPPRSAAHRQPGPPQATERPPSSPAPGLDPSAPADLRSEALAGLIREELGKVLG